MSPQGKLAGLLSYYLRVAFEAAGLDWTADNNAEVDQMAELIVEIARQVVRAVRAESERATHDAGAGS